MEVFLSKQAEKDLSKVPSFILRKFNFWMESIIEIGLEETRKYTGFHDKILKGNRRGQYSIRLNRSYRDFYELKKKNKVIYVLEVNKHEH